MKEEILMRLEKLEPITLEEMSSIRLMNRIDSKFVTNKRTLLRLLELAQGKYYVQIHAGTRIASYKTLYYDTEDHKFFRMHHNGCSPRYKVRVRTYSDTEESFLEVKKKDNHGRTKKKRIGIATTNLRQESNAEVEQFLLERSLTALSELEPCLQNRFHRITLVNKEKTERLTIDFDVVFNNVETAREAGTGSLVIVELKRDGNAYSAVHDMLQELRVKPSGFSKYCIGTVMTNPELKHNNFKKKLRKIEKIISE